jgi:hypothetical protein
MHPVELRYLQSLMDEQLQLQREIRERSSALLDGDLTIDEATTQRIILDSDEQDLFKIDRDLNSLADRGFFGYSHPGGLTLFFYGYQVTPPSAYAPGHYPRQSG